ncbi:MAG TPA: hypothetical protein VKA86_18470 [Candidatus Krumholzibacteria bacterium]|nr:hypothetical protein [Candidatus Krumholzibacteria bacterium]
MSVTGEAGVLLVSTDDGITWNDVGPGVGRGHHHLWKSSTEVFLVGEGLAHRSVDGGATWTQVFTPPFGGLQEVFLLDPDTVFALFGNGHGRSDDGGGSWTMNSTFQGPFYLIGSACLTDEHWLGISHGEGGRLWETRDAGQSWAQLLYRDCVGLTAIERQRWTPFLGQLSRCTKEESGSGFIALERKGGSIPTTRPFRP